MCIQRFDFGQDLFILFCQSIKNLKQQAEKLKSQEIKWIFFPQSNDEDGGEDGVEGGVGGNIWVKTANFVFCSALFSEPFPN